MKNTETSEIHKNMRTPMTCPHCGGWTYEWSEPGLTRTKYCKPCKIIISIDTMETVKKLPKRIWAPKAEKAHSARWYATHGLRGK